MLPPFSSQALFITGIQERLLGQAVILHHIFLVRFDRIIHVFSHDIFTMVRSSMLNMQGIHVRCVSCFTYVAIDEKGHIRMVPED